MLCWFTIIKSTHMLEIDCIAMINVLEMIKSQLH
jgi:hypothetical protein